MENWQQRIIDEKEELDTKLTKLEKFIYNEEGTFNSLPSIDQNLLGRQAEIMAEYSAILRKRIARWQ